MQTNGTGLVDNKKTVKHNESCNYEKSENNLKIDFKKRNIRMNEGSEKPHFS